mmetsp:Transcript_3624/g.7533  ORF Transcript_3624/g.7533 Transcript_3624/m.7533 type:complete len:274 (+) Transcript_3624:39-860(+)
MYISHTWSALPYGYSPAHVLAPRRLPTGLRGRVDDDMAWDDMEEVPGSWGEPAADFDRDGGGLGRPFRLDSPGGFTFEPDEGVREAVSMHNTKELVRLADQAAAPEADDYIVELLETHVDRYLEGKAADWLLDSSPEPSTEHTPEQVLKIVLQHLKDGSPHEAHGAAIAMRFSTPLATTELEWEPLDAWRRMLRKAANPRMLANELMTSRFRIWCEWALCEVEEFSVAPPNRRVDESCLSVLLISRDGLKVRFMATMELQGGTWLIRSVEGLE